MTRVSQRRYAARIGVSHVYINRLVHEGKLPADANGKIDPDEADAILAAVREPARPQRRVDGGKAEKPKAMPSVSMPQTAATGSPLSGSGDLPTMLLKTRIKSEVGRANLLELKSKVEAGKYVDADEVIRKRDRRLNGGEVFLRRSHHPAASVDYFVTAVLNVLIDLPVALNGAVLGARVHVPTARSSVAMTIPPGSNTGDTLKLKGKGMAALRKFGLRGNQHRNGKNVE